jgi:hypothetical protein
MRIARTRSGEPLEELAARLYEFEGKGSAAAARSAAKTLRDANPFLRKLDDVPEGTLLIVPPVEGAAPAAATEPVEGAVGALVAGQLREAAALAVQLLGGELNDEAADAQSSLDVLRSTEARRLAKADGEARLVHDEAGAAAKARLAAAERLGSYRSEVADRVEQDLEELLGALRGMEVAAAE